MRAEAQGFSGSRGHMDAVSLLQWAAGAFVGALILFIGFESLDIGAAAFFYHNGHFAGRTPTVEAVRDFLKIFYVAVVVAAIAGIWIGYARKADWLHLSSARWLVVLTTLIVGPGLVANVLLKDQMGRARPSQTELFGGTKAFTPPLVVASKCERNCSFVSGEASSMFAIFFGFAMVAGRHARSLIAVGIAAGCFAGLIRMAQGAHFLSDVAFAGIFMAITAALMRILIIDMARLWPAGRSADVPSGDGR